MAALKDGDIVFRGGRWYSIRAGRISLMPELARSQAGRQFVTDRDTAERLEAMALELKKMNVQLATVTGDVVDESDTGG